jgi:hypothetical protein
MPGRTLPVALIIVAALVPATEAAAKKKPKPIVATVNGTFTIRNDDPAGFGNDNGPKWQQIKVTLKNAKITFRKGNNASAAGDVSAQIDYDALAKTEDRSWHAGCDAEERTGSGSWSGKMQLFIKQTNWRINQGKSVKYRGWSVYTRLPDEGIDVTAGGYWQDWDSILMTQCNSYGTDELLGSWNPGFAQPTASGRLSKDRRSVKLSWTDTEQDQTSTTTGSIKFTGAVDR